jgi:hypothetical protein
MTKDEALRLALSTLHEVREETFRLLRNGQKLYAEDKVWSTIITIKEVLAQKEEEPVAWMYDWTTSEGEFIQNWTTSEAESLRDTEPNIISNVRPLYTNPPQRTWVGLTDEDLKLLSAEWRIVYGSWVGDFAKDIEAKLKEKNT